VMNQKVALILLMAVLSCGTIGCTEQGLKGSSVTTTHVNKTSNAVEEVVVPIQADTQIVTEKPTETIATTKAPETVATTKAPETVATTTTVEMTMESVLDISLLSSWMLVKDDVFYVDASIGRMSYSELEELFGIKLPELIMSKEDVGVYDSYFYFDYGNEGYTFFFKQDQLIVVAYGILTGDYQTICDKYINAFGECSYEFADDDYYWEGEKCDLELYCSDPETKGSIMATYVFHDEGAQTVQNVSLISLAPWTYTGKKASYGSGVLTEYADVEDIFGNYYRYSFHSNAEEVNGENSQTYRLDGQYSTLEFTVAIPSYSKGSTGTGSLYIYGDGALIFSRTDVTSSYETEFVSLDISGVKDLKIEMYGNSFYSSFFSLMIGDPYLYS